MQKYTEISASSKIADSLSLILNNDKTAISCNAGTAFPTVNLQAGMLCYRTDEDKLYVLKDVSKETWICIADSEGTFRHLEGGNGSAIPYNAKDLNSWSNMKTGFYEGTKMNNAPDGDTHWRVLSFRSDNSNGFTTQLAFGVNKDLMMIRSQVGGTWSAWRQIYSAPADGSVVTGLNANKLDSKTAGKDVGNIPINNGVLMTNLNADMVDGKHVGKETNQIPLNNGNLNTNLNADMVDGRHVGTETNQIPINDGKLNANLNAGKLGGFTASDFLIKGGDGAVSATNFNERITAPEIKVTNVEGLSASFSVNADDNTLKGNRRDFAIAPSYFKGSGYDRSESSGRKVAYYRFGTSKVFSGTESWNMTQVLKNLVKFAHSHELVRVLGNSAIDDCNCNCDCDCRCDCGDDGNA